MAKKQQQSKKKQQKRQRYNTGGGRKNLPNQGRSGGVTMENGSGGGAGINIPEDDNPIENQPPPADEPVSYTHLTLPTKA